MGQLLVTGYVNPDLDGAAGAVAYAELLQKTGSEAQAGFLGEPHDEAKYVFERFGIAVPPLFEDTTLFPDVVIVDASDLNGLEGKVMPEQVVEIIDHRAVHEADKFPRAATQIELVGAAATLVAERFMRQGISISRDAAILLYAAIISNTLNFRGTVTTDRDREAAAWLNQTAGLPDGFWKDLFAAKSDMSGPKLSERIAGDFAHFKLGEKHVGIAQIEMIGARRLLNERESEIIDALRKLQREMCLDIVFQNTIELEEGRNFLIAYDEQVRTLLEKVLAVEFVGMVAEREDLIMRKQIVPLLKAELELTASLI